MQYNAKVDVVRIQKTSDGMGGWTEVENVLHDELPCRITWPKGTESVQFMKDTHYINAMMYCAVVDITKDDRVTYDSRTYEVLDVRNPDNKNRRLTILLRLLE